MDLLFFYEIDNQECWVSRLVRALEVGKIHGIFGVAGQGGRVSGDFVRENELHIKGDEYQERCTSGILRRLITGWAVRMAHQRWRVSVDMYSLAGQLGWVSS